MVVFLKDTSEIIWLLRIIFAEIYSLHEKRNELHQFTYWGNIKLSLALSHTHTHTHSQTHTHTYLHTHTHTHTQSLPRSSSTDCSFSWSDKKGMEQVPGSLCADPFPLGLAKGSAEAIRARISSRFLGSEPCSRAASHLFKQRSCKDLTLAWGYYYMQKRGGAKRGCLQWIQQSDWSLWRMHTRHFDNRKVYWNGNSPRSRSFCAFSR